MTADLSMLTKSSVGSGRLPGPDGFGRYKCKSDGLQLFGHHNQLQVAGSKHRSQRDCGSSVKPVLEAETQERWGFT